MSYQKKKGLVTHPSIFWYDNDSGQLVHAIRELSFLPGGKEPSVCRGGFFFSYVRGGGQNCLKESKGGQEYFPKDGGQFLRDTPLFIMQGTSF